MQTTGFVLLAGFVAFFALLAADTAVRLWLARAGFVSSADFALLLTLEIVRAVVTLALVVIAIATLRRRDPGHAALAVALLFFAMWYAKVAAYDAFPGHVQQWLAVRLTGWGMPHRLLALVFGQPTWALAPAVAAFVAFASVYPAVVRPDQVRGLHNTGRRGLLRDTMLAGIDVRSIVHIGAARSLSAGLFAPRPLALLAGAGALALAFGSLAIMVSVLVLLAVVFAFGVALLRTACLIRDGQHRYRLQLLAGAGIAVVLELVACGLLTFAPGATFARVVLGLAAVAPLGALLFLSRFVLARRPLTTAEIWQLAA